MAGDVIRGSNFVIVPTVDRQSATQAEAAIEDLVKQGAKAVKEGNTALFNTLSKKMDAELKKANKDVDVKVTYETSSASGGFREVKKAADGALKGMIGDYNKMVNIQGQSALAVKKELAIHKDKINDLKRQQLLLTKNSATYKKNIELQKGHTDEAKRLEGVLARVSTLSSLKGQLRDESQKLSMMSQFNVEVDKQGKLVAVTNQEWLKQKGVVAGLGQQVHAAGNATKGFGAKIKGLGQSIQGAFGAFTAIIGGIAALAGSIGMITGRVKDIQALKLTFDGLGQSVEAQNAILASARNIALSYGVSLRKVEGAFRRLGPAILESGGSLKDTEGAIKSISARTTMLGLNTEQAGRYIEAFAQVMGKGKLQSEELNQQFSELDGGLRGQLKNWLAANKGITDFEGAMKKGEITSGVFLEAFEAINEEIRIKFLRSIGDTQKAIEEMGKKGGMTLNQLNAKLQTLTSIGLESVGQALAPLGKELMKIYAAFVQVFTKVATEMPGVAKLFEFLGHIIGVVLKVALNTVLYLFGALMEAIDQLVRGIMSLYDALKNIPGIGGMLNGLEEMGKKLNANFDSGIDGMSKLSDKTIGATSELAKYTDELVNLDAQFKKNEITQEQYAKKREEILARQAEAVRKNAEKELEIEQDKLDKLIEARTAQLDREQQLMDRKVDAINKAKDREVDAIDETIRGLEKQKDANDKLYDEKIKSVRRAHASAKQAIEDEIAALNKQKDAVKDFYSGQLEKVKEYYSQLKSEMDEAHSREMSQMNEKISKLREAQGTEMSNLDSGPENEKLGLMKIQQLRKQIAGETDRYKKQELKAQLENMRLSRERAQLEKQQAEEMKEALEEKKRLEKQQAEEKKKLDEEEKERVKQLQEAQAQALTRIRDAVEALAGIKKENARAEKDDIESLKDAKETAQEQVMSYIEEEKEARDELTEVAEAAIAKLVRAHEKERRKVEDVEWEMSKQIGTQRSIGVAVDNVTNGALDRQLQKVREIKREMASMGTPDSTDGVRFAGGPVSGGSTYTVNELGTEGFLSASGKMSEIKAPAFGSWKAPSSGSVIPAHVWKGIKASQNTEVNMPRNVSPGNAVARAISTVNNSAGDHIQNSVTIQAVNPAQAASDVMVQLAKLKRLRYN